MLRFEPKSSLTQVSNVSNLRVDTVEFEIISEIEEVG